MRDLYVKKAYNNDGWVVWRGNPDEESPYAILNANVEKWFFTKRGAVRYAKRVLEAHKVAAERITLEDLDD